MKTVPYKVNKYFVKRIKSCLMIMNEYNCDANNYFGLFKYKR